MKWQVSVLFLGFGASTYLACGGSEAITKDAGSDAGEPDVTTPDEDAGGDETNPYPAPHPPMPYVVNEKGPVLATPKVIPIFFASYPHKAAVEDFVTKLGPSGFWKETTAEYGVGVLTVGKSIELTEAPPTQISDFDIQLWLSDKLDGTHVDWGSADTNAIYAIYYPQSTTIYSGDIPDGSAPTGGKSCSSFGGYHSDTVLNGSKMVSYAIIPDCGSFAGLNGADAITAVSSHELVEAATDPYPMHDPAYSHHDLDHLAWNALGAGETADMCAQYGSSYYTPADIGHVVQRSWSNASGAASHDPCVPAQGEVYFNSAPVLDDTITVKNGLTTIDTKGVKIPLGTTRTIELDLYSDGPTTGPWTVSAAERFGVSQRLDLVLDKTTGQNGDKLNLAITAKTASTKGATTFIITSTLGTRKTYWAGYVGN